MTPASTIPAPGEAVFWNKELSTSYNPTITGIVTDGGVGSIWQPTPAELLDIAAGRPVLIFFPGESVHPPVHIQALADPDDDATLGIPPETGLQCAQLTTGPGAGYSIPASFGRAPVLRPDEDPEDPTSYDAYGHIPGDPVNEFQHLPTYLVDNIPGADYVEKSANLETEAEEVNAWRVQNYTALAHGVLPPNVADLDTPIDRVAANLVLIHYPNTPRPVPPGP